MSNKCQCETSADDCKDKDAESKSLPDEVIYEDPDYLKQLFAALNQFRSDEKYCDFFFCMEEQRLCAHKVILSAASPFFNERFRDGCICVEKEGTGKDGDDTPSIGDCKDDASLDGAGLDGADLDDASLLEDTLVNKGCAERRKDEPIRERTCENFEGDETVASCNIDDQPLNSDHCDVSVTKEEHIDPCFSDDPTVLFISQYRVIDAKRVKESETCCDDIDFSSYTSCEQAEKVCYGCENRKAARSLISRYMDEVPLRTNRSFSREANKKYISKGYCLCENELSAGIYCLENANQRTTEAQIYKDTPLVSPSATKRVIEKIPSVTECMDEPSSSVSNTFVPCPTNSTEKVREKRSYENTPAAYACDTKEEYREREICKEENEAIPLSSSKCPCFCVDESKEDVREQWADNLTPYACDAKKEKKDLMTPPLCCSDPEKHNRIPRKWPSKSIASSDTKVEERVRTWSGRLRRSCFGEEEKSAAICPDKTVCCCDTKEEQERTRIGISDTEEGEARIGKGPSKPVGACDTKEATEKISKWPSKDTCSCDTKEEEIRNRKGCSNALASSCTTEQEERINKWPSKPGLSNETREDEERTMKRPSKPILPKETKGKERVKKWPSKVACFCDANDGEKIKKWPNLSNPVCCCDAEEIVGRSKNRPTCLCDSEEEDNISRTWSGEIGKATSERAPDECLQNITAFCCDTNEKDRRQSTDSSSICFPNTKVNEEVTEQHKGKTIRSNALKQETKEAETWPSEPACTEDEPKDECKIRLTCKSRDNSPKTSSKDSLTCSVQTEEFKEDRSCKSSCICSCFSSCENKEKIKSALLKEREKWTDKGPCKPGSMKAEGEEKSSCKCPSIGSSEIEQETEGFREGGGWLYQFTEDSSKHHINTKEQRSSKTVKDSALRCFNDTIEDFGCTNEEPACTKESLVRLAGEKEECTRRRVCETFSQNFSDTKEAARRMREKEDSKDKRGNISQAYNNGPNEKTAPSKIRSSKSTCCNNIKEAGRCARKGKEIKGTPFERKIQTTIAGTSAYPDDANKITDMEDEVPVRKNSSFVCVPEVKEGTIKRWLWKGDTSRRTCKDTNASNAEANSGGRWVCENFNALTVGPQCACDVQEDAGFAHGNEIPIRKNKSFVCVPEIAEEGVERWTYKNMNASSYSRSSNRTQGGGGSQWILSDNDLGSKTSTSCKCCKCAPKPKIVPMQDDVRDDMFSDATRKGVKFGNVANTYRSCVKEYNPYGKYDNACIPCNSRGEGKDDNVTARLTDIRGPFSSDIEEHTKESMKVPDACTMASGVPCIKKEDIKGKSGMMQFEDIDIDTLKQIIDFIYSGKLTVNEKNVRNLLLASSLLQIDWITKKCFQFCKHRLNISNCFSLRKLAVAYDRTDLCDRCDDYIYRNFLEVIDTDEYGLLCFEEVKDLLSSNEIVTDTEVSVFDGVINWIKHCPSERLPLLLPLMNCVRLPIMSAKCLMTCVANEPYIKDNPECKDLLLDAMKYHLVPEKRYLMISERTQERKPSKMISHVILAGANCSEGRMYDKNFTNCVCMARMKQRRCQAGVTSWHNLLYVVGGKDQNNSLKTAECYNPLTNAWTNIPSMAAKHCNFGICSMYGLIYACGGHDGCSIHNYVECYDTLTSKWISCPAMKCSLDNTHASALDNCIYCMGTIGGLTNFERFDLREGIWCKMPSLLNYRKYSDMVSYGNCLFCMGGLSLDNRAQNTGERFDVRSNKWEHISSMPSARYGHSMVEIDSNIYVIGGDRNLTVEYYNIGLNEWVQLESASIKHSFGGAAVVNCFPLK